MENKTFLRGQPSVPKLPKSGGGIKTGIPTTPPPTKK